MRASVISPVDAVVFPVLLLSSPLYSSCREDSETMLTVLSVTDIGQRDRVDQKCSVRSSVKRKIRGKREFSKAKNKYSNFQTKVQRSSAAVALPASLLGAGGGGGGKGMGEGARE